MDQVARAVDVHTDLSRVSELSSNLVFAKPIPPGTEAQYAAAMSVDGNAVIVEPELARNEGGLRVAHARRKHCDGA
jgi:hypothetical protein